jgi:prepilin-type N-terminal cleavage/methylation domain-containing protein
MTKQKGFTLIELLVVLGIIAILAAIVIIAVNPARQFAISRNTAREANVNSILSATWQYAIDNQGNLPATITDTATEICKTDVASCGGLVDLSVLTADGKYIVKIPEDQKGSSTNGTGYFIQKMSNGRIKVTAPHAELGNVIEVQQ